MLAGPAILTATESTLAAEDHGKVEKNVFVHQVYFWLKEPSSKAARDKLIEGLNSLRRIKTLKSSHIGVPAATTRDVVDGSYSISWLTIFKNRAGHDSYQTDPVHLKFVEEYAKLWSKVLVYDSIDPA